MFVYIYIYIYGIVVCISTRQWVYIRGVYSSDIHTGVYLHMKCTRRTDLDGVHVFVFMAVILTDDLFSYINMPKKKKSPKRRAETPQSVARRLGIIDEDDR